jgi:hypothetical protein
MQIQWLICTLGIVASRSVRYSCYASRYYMRDLVSQTFTPVVMNVWKTERNMQKHLSIFES